MNNIKEENKKPDFKKKPLWQKVKKWLKYRTIEIFFHLIPICLLLYNMLNVYLNQIAIFTSCWMFTVCWYNGA